MKVAVNCVMLYAAFLLIGGTIGYVKSQSLISLCMGIGTAVLMAGFGVLMLKEKVIGVYLSIFGAAALGGFFLFRFFVAYKVMPGGLMFIMSLLLLLPLLKALKQCKRTAG